MAIRMSQADVASCLCVPDGTLDLVTLLDETCPTQGCNNLGIHGYGGGRCVFHSQSWLPRAKDKDNKLRANRRGYELLGPEQHQRNFSSGFGACCCDLEVCIGIGYLHHGMFRMPADKMHVTKFVEKLSVSSEKKARIIAPWNFFRAPKAS
jgi:hypothetical protein